MEDKAKRSPGGKLALWAFYAFCGYFLWAMARYWWVVGQIQSVPGATIDGELGSTSGKWIGALLGVSGVRYRGDHSWCNCVVHASQSADL